MRTRNNETVMVPNAWLLKNRFTVIGASSDPDTGLAALDLVPHQRPA